MEQRQGSLESLAVNPRFWQDKRVLVTGHTGFKGAWLSYWLSRSGARVTGLALAPEGEPNLYRAAHLDDIVESHIEDVRNADAVRRIVQASRPDVIIHMAAQPLVRTSYDRPVYTYEVNALGTAHVLEAARVAPSVRAIVCVTTDKCYENREWIWPYRETDSLGGHDPYSSSKACAEIIASAYARSFFNSVESGVATARGGNVIGGGDWSVDRIIPDLVRAFSSGKPGIVRNPHSVRPWQSVLDALNGYLILAMRLHDEPRSYSEAWNFGPDASAEWRVGAVAERVTRAWNGGAHWEHRAPENAPHEAQLLKLDSTKARSRLRWRDLLSTAETIDRLARWYARYYEGADARDLMDEDLNEFSARMEFAA